MTSQKKTCKHLTQYTFLKRGVSNYDLLYMQPALLMIFAFVSNYCHQRSIRFEVSSIYRPPGDGISKSSTHQQMRAFDLSLRGEHGWNMTKIHDLVARVEKNFRHYGAISAASGEARPVVIHDAGSGMHAHFQVRPNL